MFPFTRRNLDKILSLLWNDTMKKRISFEVEKLLSLDTRVQKMSEKTTSKKKKEHKTGKLMEDFECV